jgi:hypothetical protein
MTERNLPAKLLASLQWCSKSGLMPGLGCAGQGLEQEDERKEAGRRVKLGASAPAGNTVKRYETDIKELRLAVMQLQIKLQDSTREHSSVKKLMDNLRMITLSLDRDFDAWKPEDSQSLADTVAESAGVAKEHVKILDCQRGSVIASTVILAPDWVAVAEKLKTSLMDESGSLKDMGVVGCAGLIGGVVGKPPQTLADVAASVVPSGSRVKLGASAPGGAARGSVAADCLVEKNTRLVERVVARWTRRDVSATLNAWKASVSNHRRVSMLGARIVGHWTHLQLSQAYETWHDHAHALALSRDRLRRITVSWWVREMSVAFFSWQDNASRRQRAVRICTRVVKHLLHRCCVAGFQGWRAHALEQKRMEQVCKHIVQKMLNHSLDVAMMTWKDHACKQQRATTVCARVVSHWLHRCTANAFESWHLHAKEQRRMEDLCSKIVRHMLNLQVCSMPLHSGVVCCDVIVACSDGLFDMCCLLAHFMAAAGNGLRNLEGSRQETGPGREHLPACAQTLDPSNCSRLVSGLASACAGAEEDGAGVQAHRAKNAQP